MAESPIAASGEDDNYFSQELRGERYCMRLYYKKRDMAHILVNQLH